MPSTPTSSPLIGTPLSDRIKRRDLVSGPPTLPSSLDLAVIGNCSYSALIDARGQIVFSCFPRFDGDPIFCSLLKQSSSLPNDIGFFDINLYHCVRSEQSYLRNSAVLATKLYDSDDACLEIVDYVPRFKSHDREYRPNMLVRILTPIHGRPRAQIRLRPTFGYGWGTPEKTRGSNHIRYLLSNMTIRLTTNAPISYVVDEVLFEIDEPIYLILMPDESLKAPLRELANDYLSKTLSYWGEWVQSLTIPLEWQEEVLRAAITLKLGNFEETGAIVAAMTTSIPIAPSGGNYDLRYCWLRDAYWVVSVLNQLGATATMERYLRFLGNIVAAFHANKQSRRINSVYGISLETRLHEREMHRLSGYKGIGPVRLGNKDAETEQNDVYGAVILALTQVFFDLRLSIQGDEILFRKLELLGEEAKNVFKKPAFGPRVRTTIPQVHTYSALMCWAACDRLAKIANKLELKDRAEYWQQSAKTLKEEILTNAWNDKLKSFVNVFGGGQVDPYLLFFPQVGFISATDERFLSTLKHIENTLVTPNGMMKWHPNDPIAVNAETLRYITILSEVGRREEARQLFDKFLEKMNVSGMLSETIDPETGELWGNFPQMSAMVGLITCAVALSKPWKDVL